MGIFSEMYEKRRFDSEKEYAELKRMLSEAIARGYVEQIEVLKPDPLSPNQQWYRDKETGEIYSLVKPGETRGWWARIDAEDITNIGDSVH